MANGKQGIFVGWVLIVVARDSQVAFIHSIGRAHAAPFWVWSFKIPGSPFMCDSGIFFLNTSVLLWVVRDDSMDLPVASNPALAIIHHLEKF